MKSRARSRTRTPSPATFATLASCALAALSLARPVAAQVATIQPNLGTIERLTLARTGAFEVWQDTSRLGTEAYRVYLTPKRDSLIAASTVRYNLRDSVGPFLYEKYTMLVVRALDSFPRLYQSAEVLGDRQRALNTIVYDTTATIYREADGRGVGNVVALPPGRLYVLDPSVYQHVENLVGEFLARGIPSRSFQVLVPPRDSVVQIQLTRGPKETVELPGQAKARATRVDLYDDLTLIQAWVDAEGRLLRLVAPAQKMRVLRLPPSEAEAPASARRTE